MHWVGLNRFSWAHVKEAIIKKARFVDKASVRHVACVLSFTARIIMRIHIKAVGRNLSVQIKTLFKRIPKCIKIRTTGKSSRHANDGNF